MSLSLEVRSVWCLCLFFPRRFGPDGKCSLVAAIHLINNSAYTNFVLIHCLMHPQVATQHMSWYLFFRLAVTRSTCSLVAPRLGKKSSHASCNVQVKRRKWLTMEMLIIHLRRLYKQSRVRYASIKFMAIGNYFSSSKSEALNILLIIHRSSSERQYYYHQ